jgi:hypothetical protein
VRKLMSVLEKKNRWAFSYKRICVFNFVFIDYNT